MSSPQPPSTNLGDSTGEYATKAKPGVRLEFGAMTHPGKVRTNNEDHFPVARLAKSMSVCKTSLPDDGSMLFSEEEGYLMVVADGMGGAAAGERASALAVLSVETFVLNTLKWFFHINPTEENVLFNELRQGLERADRTVVERARANPNLRILGVVITMHDKRTALARDIRSQIDKVFGSKVFKTVITKSVRLEESPAYKESIFSFAPDSSGASEYYRLCEEVMDRE